MRRSQSFLKTRREAPADEVARNAQLLTRAGYIHKEMAGVYSFLPLGLAVLRNIIEIIRQEMNAIGGEELVMSTLQPKELWEKSGRWHDEVIDIWYKTRMHGGRGFHTGPELGLGNTHEEALTDAMRGFVSSYKDLPVYAYQFQTKLRNEPRAKSGLLRCREFIMKDLYSFSVSQEEHDNFYEKAKVAYTKVFDRLGLGDITVFTYASGGSFTSDFSHEFQTVMDVGEDTIYVHEGKNIALNEEILSDESLSKIGVEREDLVEKKAIEVGNIFPLGTKFPEALDLMFTDKDGKSKAPIMGSYGIGPTRLVGTLVERFADKKGLVWPKNITPYDVYLARLGSSETVVANADELYDRLTENGISVIYDDRDERAGEMFADADLLGIPSRLVVSKQSIESGHFELKERSSDRPKNIPVDNLETLVKNLKS